MEDEPSVKLEPFSGGVDPLANVTASSCDYSLSHFKEEPLDEKMDEDSEEDIPLVNNPSTYYSSHFSRVSFLTSLIDLRFLRFFL